MIIGTLAILQAFLKQSSMGSKKKKKETVVSATEEQALEQALEIIESKETQKALAKDKSTGVLMIAIGDPFYLNLAYNLALTLKQSDCHVPVALLTDDKKLSHLMPDQAKVFDHVIPAEDGDYIDPEQMRQNPFMLKTRIYKYSPFDRTLFLDADQLHLSDHKSLCKLLFDVLKDVEFQMHEVKRYTKANAHESGMIWTKTPTAGQSFPKMWEAFGFAEDAIFPEYNSSFIFFTKCEANEKFFERVAANYFERKVEWTAIGTFYPDELAWGVTSAQMKYYGSIEHFRPCWLNWESDKGITFEQVAQHYYFLNMASGYQPSNQIAWYDNTIKRVRFNAGDRFPFTFNMRKKIFFQKH